MSLWHTITGPLYPLLDWPFDTGRNGGYNLWSGLGPAIFWPLVYLRRHNCHVRWCPRLAWHPDPRHGGHLVCRRHHPDGPVRPNPTPDRDARRDQ